MNRTPPPHDYLVSVVTQARELVSQVDFIERYHSEDEKSREAIRIVRAILDEMTPAKNTIREKVVDSR